MAQQNTDSWGFLGKVVVGAGAAWLALRLLEKPAVAAPTPIRATTDMEEIRLLLNRIARRMPCGGMEG